MTEGRSVNGRICEGRRVHGGMEDVTFQNC